MAEASSNKNVFDTGQQYLGGVYAKGLLAASEKAGNTDQVLAELNSLVDDVLDKLPKFEAALASPRIGHEEKAQMLDRAFAGKISTQMLNFLKVVSRHGRLDCLRAIRRAARRLYNEQHGRLEVVLRTAEPVGDELLGQIVQRLQAALSSQVEIKVEVDPELIGGMVVRIGDTVYDGSVLNQLNQLRDEALDRTVAQLRSASDRFAVAQ